MPRPSPRLMLRQDTTVDTTDTAPTATVCPHTTDTVPTAMATPPMPDTATTTARGLLMLRLSPRLMLRLDTTVDTMDTVPMDMVFPHTTDTVPMATATPPTLDMATTTARGLLMPRPSPRLMLRQDTTVDTTDTAPTATVCPHTTDTVPTAMATPPMPDMATTTARGLLMLRLSPRLTPRLTTMAAMATPAMLMATVPTAMAPMDTVHMPMVPTHTPMEPTTTKLLILDLLYKK